MKTSAGSSKLATTTSCEKYPVMNQVAASHDTLMFATRATSSSIGPWIDRVARRLPHRTLIQDMSGANSASDFPNPWRFKSGVRTRNWQMASNSPIIVKAGAINVVAGSFPRGHKSGSLQSRPSDAQRPPIKTLRTLKKSDNSCKHRRMRTKVFLNFSPTNRCPPHTVYEE